MKKLVVIFGVLLVVVTALCWQAWTAVAAPDLENGAGQRAESASDVVGAEDRRDEPGREDPGGDEPPLQRSPEESWRIAAMVRDALGDGVEGARIEVRSAPGGALLAKAVAGQRGVARFDVRGETLFVRARHPDLGVSLEHRLTRKRRSCVMVLQRPVRMRGYAFDARGQPLAGALVELLDGNGVTLRNLLGGPSDARVIPSRMRADEDGAFAFEAPAGWNGVACVKMPNGGILSDPGSAPFTVQEGRDVLVGLPGAFCVRGVVLDANGEAVDALVWAVGSVVGRRPVSSSSFSIAVEPGETTRILASANSQIGSVDVTATRANPQPRVVIHLGRGDGVPSVFRSLRDDSIEVVATCSDGSAPPTLRYRWVDETFTRSLGDPERVKGSSIRLGRAPLPPARLWVKARSGEVATWVLPAGGLPKRVALRLQKPVDVEVEVLHQGRPARGLTATLYACGTRETVKMRRPGRARFTRVCPGPAKVVVKRGWELVGEQRLFLAEIGTTRVTVPVDLSR